MLAFALIMALSGLLNTLAGTAALQGLTDTVLQDRAVTAFEMMARYPYLPVGFIASTVLLSLAGINVSSDTRIFSRIRDHLMGAAAPDFWRGIVTAASSIVVLICALYPLHFGMVAAGSSVAGIGHFTAIHEAIPEWIADQRKKGLTTVEIATRLTQEGHWRKGAPDSGLTMLMPELSAKLNELGGACEITVAAATADPSAVAGKDWISDWISKEVAQSDIKYCMRIACPSPVAWQAPPSILLGSSHPSQKENWMGPLYVDLSADGVASAPGGYCTVDGKLADDFQG